MMINSWSSMMIVVNSLIIIDILSITVQSKTNGTDQSRFMKVQAGNNILNIIYKKVF